MGSKYEDMQVAKVVGITAVLLALIFAAFGITVGCQRMKQQEEDE